MRSTTSLIALLFAGSVSAAEFSFVAIGDTAYNGERDYVVYRKLISSINQTKPTFTIHVGDLWGIGNCHDAQIERIKTFFDLYDHPVVLTPGDNEWIDCRHRAMGGYDPMERLQALRNAFFSKAQSLGKSMPVVRQADVSPYTSFVENQRWSHENVLFLTLNVPGSNNGFDYTHAASLAEAQARTAANIAWMRDSFRIARTGPAVAVVIALHAEMFMNGELKLSSFNGPLSGPYGALIKELRLGAERFGGPVLLVHGDSHEFVVDRPLFESQGEAAPPKFGNVIRLEVFGAPELEAVRVQVDTRSSTMFGFSPLLPGD